MCKRHPGKHPRGWELWDSRFFAAFKDLFECEPNLSGCPPAGWEVRLSWASTSMWSRQTVVSRLSTEKRSRCWASTNIEDADAANIVISSRSYCLQVTPKKQARIVERSWASRGKG